VRVVVLLTSRASHAASRFHRAGPRGERSVKRDWSVALWARRGNVGGEGAAGGRLSGGRGGATVSSRRRR
jgi:hypothetical protein